MCFRVLLEQLVSQASKLTAYIACNCLLSRQLGKYNAAFDGYVNSITGRCRLAATQAGVNLTKAFNPFVL